MTDKLTATAVANAMAEAAFNDAEAHDLLALIDAEFQSDPVSTQCFDLRIVERVRHCVARREQFLEAQAIGFVKPASLTKP